MTAKSNADRNCLRFRTTKGRWLTDEIAAIEIQVKNEIAAAVDFAVNSPYPKPEEAERDFFT